MPNIILICADQWGAASVGTYGCPVPDVTPTIDRLAAEGTRYDRCYTTTPVCAPNRATIFTGRSPAVHGLMFNNMVLRSDPPTFAHELRRAGYRTFGFGKFHFTPMHVWPPDELDHLGFDHVEVTEDTKHGAWLDWIEREHPEWYEQALAVAWPMPYLGNYGPDGGRDVRADFVAAHTRWVAPHVPDAAHRFYESPLPAELHQTTWITDRAIHALENVGDEPFFMFVSYVDPHDPYDPPAPYSTMFKPADMPAPAPQEWTSDWCPVDYRELRDGVLNIGSLTPDEWLQLRALYFGSCRFIDDQIGRLLDAVGDREDTIVIFTTDHGDMIGDHGLLMKGAFHYDRCVRVPLIIRTPGQTPEVSSELVSTLDFFPTILEMAGVESDVPVEGRSLVSEPAPTDVLMELNDFHRVRSRSIVTDDGWRLSIFPGQDYGELFHLTTDPDEQRNLWRDPAHDAVRLDLMRRLIERESRQTFPLVTRNQAPEIDYSGSGFTMRRP